jgi:hypothetical protein
VPKCWAVGVVGRISVELFFSSWPSKKFQLTNFLLLITSVVRKIAGWKLFFVKDEKYDISTEDTNDKGYDGSQYGGIIMVLGTHVRSPF